MHLKRTQGWEPGKMIAVSDGSLSPEDFPDLATEVHLAAFVFKSEELGEV